MMKKLPVPFPQRSYYAEVTRIYDGDTIYVFADQGFHDYTWLKIRLDSINTDEIRGVERREGLEDKAYVQTLLSVGDTIIMQSLKDKRTKSGGFGRWAARIWVVIDREGDRNDPDNWLDLNYHLIEEGIAEYFPH